MEKVTIRILDTPNGRLLSAAFDIMRRDGVTMGEALDQAKRDAADAALDNINR